MGISGLLPLLKSIHKPCNLKKFDGKTIGVDAYGWLHRGTVSCAIDLALGKPTTKYVEFAMSRVRMLVHFGITPYIVFDGDYLPSKAGTEVERAARRKESRRVGLELLKLGKTSQAHLELQKAVDVTPEMARLLIEELKHHNIQYVVAPYEADSQLAYLERNGIIDGILSEDSDLLVFGAKSLITKLDQYGDCVEINRNLFTACREISLVGWTDADFRRMAILSGCDYLPSISKMGLKTAYRLLRKHKTVERVIKAAQFDGQFKVPEGYLEAFTQAEQTFLYQWVFCPVAKKVVNCTEPATGVDPNELPFIGKCVPSDIAIGVARGELNPHTKEPIIVPAKDQSQFKPLRPNMRNAVAQTPDPKKSKPIDIFFKPKRTPLAELDPNSFTPSPSQQNLLRQRNEGWVASMAPPQRPASVIRTAPHLSRRAISDSSARIATAPNPSKRPRLCDDSSIDTPREGSGKVESGRSRFFSSVISEPSPSMRPAKKKRQDSDFNLWSDDDSIDDTMAELAGLDNAPGKSKKIRVFQEGSRSFSQGTQSTQSTPLSQSTVDNSQDLSGTLTPATSFGSPTPDGEEESTCAGASTSRMNGFREKFTFARAKKGHTYPLATVSSGTAHGKVLARTSSAPASSKVLHAIVKPAPTGSLLRNSSMASPRGSLVPVTDDEGSEIEDSAWAEMETRVVKPANESEEAAAPVAKQGIQLHGSEDLLVPDSEGDSDGSPRVKKVLDLGRFAFIEN
jgi:exonuclease-1